MQFIIGVGVSIIIARILGPEGRGIYFLAMLLPSLLITFGNFGIGQASIFYIGKRKYSSEEVLGSNIILSLLFGISGFLVGLTIVLLFRDSLFPGIARIYLILALLALPLEFFLIFVGYFLLGLQRIKEFNFINIIQSFILLLLLLILLLGFKFGIKTTITANILSCFIGVIILFYLTKKIKGAIHLSCNKFYVKDAFKYGFKVYLVNFISFLHYRIDIFLINLLLNPLAVGFYSIAVALAEKIWLISQSAALVLFPRVSSETDKKRLKEFTPLVCRSILLITSLGAILLFFLARMLIIFFYSNKFSNSVLPFQILLIGAVAISGWKILANDIHGRGKPELNIYVSATSVVLNVFLNIIWIPKYGIVGAAWATSLSYSFAFIVITILYSKISGNYIWSVILPKKDDFYLYKNLLKKLVFSAATNT